MPRNPSRAMQGWATIGSRFWTIMQEVLLYRMYRSMLRLPGLSAIADRMAMIDYAAPPQSGLVLAAWHASWQLRRRLHARTTRAVAAERQKAASHAFAAWRAMAMARPAFATRIASHVGRRRGASLRAGLTRLMVNRGRGLHAEQVKSRAQRAARRADSPPRAPSRPAPRRTRPEPRKGSPA